jgi:hypothetical protein
MHIPVFRCPMRSWNRANKLGYPHTKPLHICEECRCRNVAGWGTKGDFWGLGEHVGHLGIGPCKQHAWKQFGRNKEREWEYCMKLVRAQQVLGNQTTTGRAYEAYLEAEAREAKEHNDAVKGLRFVIDTLDDFKAATEGKSKDGKELMEYVQGASVPMSDKVRIGLSLDIAKTLSSLVKDQLIITSDSYVHVDEIKQRLPKQIALGKHLFSRLKELIAGFKQGNRDPIATVEEEWIEGHKDIWSNTTTGRMPRKHNENKEGD